MKKKIALIFGITGQDGSYLAELLLKKNYIVNGVKRRSSSINTSRVDHIYQDPHEKNYKFRLFYGDITDSLSVSRIIKKTKPDEIYNLAAQSHVAVSFKNPLYTTQTSTVGPLTILEAVKNSDKQIKYYQASSSEMFGGIDSNSLNEESKFVPKSPYAAGKLFAHEMTKIYRDSYDIFAVNGILFNHESPLRGETFVTRKISKAVGRISQGIQSKLTLGNLEAFRDWGFAGDYVKGMYLMMQHEKPDDWVLSSDETHTVKEFVKIAFECVNLNWEDYVVTSKKYERPNEVEHLLGDSTKARTKLNWAPEVSFKELVEMMVAADIKEATREKVLLDQNLIKPTWENPA